MSETSIASFSARFSAPEEFCRTEVAARRFGVSRRILLSWERHGLSFYRPNSRVTLVKIEDVNSFLSQVRTSQKSGRVT
jgi:hypothetical protein